MVRGVRPVAIVVDETMFLRVTVNVGDQSGEVPIVVDQSALEGAFKQAARSLVRLVEGLGIGDEEVVELAADMQDWSNLRDWTSLRLFDAHQEVKVIVQKAVSVGFGNGLDVFGSQLEEVAVVALFAEQRFAVDATIVDVVVLIKLERFWS